MITIVIFIAVLMIVGALTCVNNSYEKCYTTMKYSGHAAMGCCHGLAGGGESCIECPHFVLLYDTAKEAEEND